MSPLLSPAGAAFPIHIPAPPPIPASLFGLLHHTSAVELALASFAVSKATTHPGGLPFPPPPPNAMTTAFEPVGLVANARPARCICLNRLKWAPPTVYPSTSADGNRSLLKSD